MWKFPLPPKICNTVWQRFFLRIFKWVIKGREGERALFFIFQPATCNECGCFDREIKEKRGKLSVPSFFLFVPENSTWPNFKNEGKVKPVCISHTANGEHFPTNIIAIYVNVMFISRGCCFFACSQTRFSPSKKASKMYVYYHNFTYCSPFVYLCVANWLA